MFLIYILKVMGCMPMMEMLPCKLIYRDVFWRLYELNELEEVPFFLNNFQSHQT